MEKAKICAGIVTYNPNIDRLQKNYESIKSQVDTVFVCDNGSKNIESVERLFAGTNVQLIRNKENKGIAAALNELCADAIKYNYKWIFTLDQDSVCSVDLVLELGKLCNENVAIVGTRILYEGNEEYSATFNEPIENVDWVITSGSLTNLKIWEQLGGFDEWMFIDKVDTEYGVRANSHHYLVIRNNETVLNHELGKLYCKKILGRTVYVTNYSAFRIYYQCRNNIYLYKKLKYGHPVREECKIILKILLYESDKIMKLRSAFRGIRSGIKSQTSNN